MITWAILESVSFLLLLVSRCERVSFPRSWVCGARADKGGDCLGLRVYPASCSTSQIPPRTALMACPRSANLVLRGRSRPITPLGISSLWSSGSCSLRGEALAPTVRLPGVILEAGVYPQHLGLGALSSYPLPPCFASSCSPAMLSFPFTIRYLIHIDLTTCIPGTSFLFAVMLFSFVEVVGITVVYFLYKSSFPPTWFQRHPRARDTTTILSSPEQTSRSFRGRVLLKRLHLAALARSQRRFRALTTAPRP